MPVFRVEKAGAVEDKYSQHGYDPQPIDVMPSLPHRNRAQRHSVLRGVQFGERLKLTHSRRKREWTPMMVFKFHKSFNYPARAAVACSVWSAPSMGALQMGFKSPVGKPNMMRTKEVMDKLLPEVNSGRVTDPPSPRLRQGMPGGGRLGDLRSLGSDERTRPKRESRRVNEAGATPTGCCWNWRTGCADG